MGRNDRGNSPAVGARHNRDAAPMRNGFTHIPDAEQEVLSAPHTLITGMHVPNGGTAPWRSANRSLRSPRRCSGTFPGISADGRATDVGGATEGSPPPIPRQSAVGGSREGRAGDPWGAQASALPPLLCPPPIRCTGRQSWPLCGPPGPDSGPHRLPPAGNGIPLAKNSQNFAPSKEP